MSSSDTAVVGEQTKPEMDRRRAQAQTSGLGAKQDTHVGRKQA